MLKIETSSSTFARKIQKIAVWAIFIRTSASTFQFLKDRDSLLICNVSYKAIKYEVSTNERNFEYPMKYL